MSNYAYLRLSTSEETQQNSFEVQQKHITDKYKIDVFFKETTSGSTPFDKRPAWLELMQIVKPDDNIIIHRLDRLSRDTLHYLVVERHLAKMGVNLIFVEGVQGDSPMDKMVRTILSAVSEMERSMIQQRVKQTMRHMRSQGLKTGGKPPYGYYVKERRLLPHEEEQAVISKMRQLRADGLSYNKIARALNDASIPTRSGSPWVAMQISRALKYEECKIDATIQHNGVNNEEDNRHMAS